MGQHTPLPVLKMKFDDADAGKCDISSAFSALHLSDLTPSISRNDFAGGKTLFLYQISESRKGVLSQKKRGQLSLELTFGNDVEIPLTLLVYGRFQSDFRIEASRAVLVT